MTLSIRDIKIPSIDRVMAAQFNYSIADIVLLVYKNLYIIFFLALVFMLNMDPGRQSIVSDMMREMQKGTTGKTI
jgi:hypothetical protein